MTVLRCVEAVASLQADPHFIREVEASPEELRTPRLRAVAVEDPTVEEAAFRAVGAAERLMVEAVEVGLPEEAVVALRRAVGRTSRRLVPLALRTSARMP
jgi:hypothetical protein